MPSNKGLPTTGWAVGPMQPTCTVPGGCGGKLCTTNCYVTGVPPVSDDCEKATATNYVRLPSRFDISVYAMDNSNCAMYWVSCGSSSCTTTSSSLTTGCYVTPTATTTGASCVRTSLYAYEDQGDDDVPNRVPTVPSTIQFPINVPNSATTFICFQDITTFREISSDHIAQNAISGLCDSGKTLYASGPPVTDTIADLHGLGFLVAQVGWDTGSAGNCLSQRDMPISPPQCKNYLQQFINDCIPRAFNKRFGGGFIQATSDGCIKWSIFAVPL